MPHTPPDVKSLRDVLLGWDRRARIALDSHAWSERFYDRLNSLLIVLSLVGLVLLGVAAGSFNLSEGGNRYWAVGLSALAAAASVLLAVRDYGSKAERHRLSSRQFGEIRREIERALALKDGSTAMARSIERIEQHWNLVAQMSLNAPPRIHERAKAKRREEQRDAGKRWWKLWWG